MGISIFEHVTLDYMEAGGMSMGLLYATVFLSVAALMGVSKYGFHLV